jgi:hypothetical protein
MFFYGSLRHVELARNLRVFTTLQQELDDLPLPWAKSHFLFFHRWIPFFLLQAGSSSGKFSRTPIFAQAMLKQRSSGGAGPNGRKKFRQPLELTASPQSYELPVARVISHTGRQPILENTTMQNCEAQSGKSIMTFRENI